MRSRTGFQLAQGIMHYDPDEQSAEEDHRQSSATPV